jgi:hypothetical protein
MHRCSADRDRTLSRQLSLAMDGDDSPGHRALGAVGARIPGRPAIGSRRLSGPTPGFYGVTKMHAPHSAEAVSGDIPYRLRTFDVIGMKFA